MMNKTISSLPVAFATLLLTMTSQPARAWSDNGTETNPELITTTSDLDQQEDVPTIYLEDHDDNGLIIWENDGKTCKVVLKDRTLYKDGKWNTLTLPFDVDMTDPTGPLYGATYYTVADASIEGTTLNLTFGKTWNGDPDKENTLVAGTPYIIKWDKPADYVAYDGQNAATCSDLVSPVFNNVKLNNTGVDFCNADESFRFLGFFNALLDITGSLEFWLGEGYDVLLMGADNTLHYAGSGASLGACRACFLVNPAKVGNVGQDGARLTSFNINFLDGQSGEAEPTSISGELFDERSVNGEGLASASVWYTLDGRQLNGKPAVHGIYLKNGKKVVIR